MAFPTLFPYRKGDWFNQERMVEVKLGEYNKHMLKYAAKIPKCNDGLEPEYLYPFAEHGRWVNWTQNIGEWHRFNCQRNVYLQKNPEDANLNENELRKIVQDNGPELKRIINRMQTYNSNIVGSNAYFYGKRCELETLTNQKDPCKIWYTLSAADNHWIDLHKLLYGNKPLPDISGPVKNVQWKRSMACRFSHIVDTFFCKQVENLFNTIFSEAGLSCKWWWKRCEWQKRGTVHIHGCFRLDCDPGIIKSAKIVLKACMAEFTMNKNRGWEFIDESKKISFPKNSTFSDEWITPEEMKGDKNERTYPVMKKETAEAYITMIWERFEHEKIINKFQDWLICTENNQVREDSTSETQTTNTRFKYTADGPQHPSGLDLIRYFNKRCGFIDLCLYSDLYGSILQVVQRHYCNNYCETKKYKNIL